ncbi:uncharacterized protein LOC111715390 [Eurytemora carolleeae]|uniref:uncharacterized protein LOC111715390 n=1 Tax=Eurytemora carolleeae TaxID=1294199 RepID=UPI000C782D9F|nr:uncharacterized protein LOC111715390 [Eurytemora carolleeae]|eukprot:XP_023346473.1 uncharacterized protein LOC111715390 [Eurytemora affinis]
MTGVDNIRAFPPMMMIFKPRGVNEQLTLDIERISTSSQDSSESQNSRKSSILPRRKSHLESIQQSDSDSVLSAAETLVDTRESSSRIRRGNASRTVKPNKPVKRTLSLNSKVNGTASRVNRSLSDRRNTVSNGSSKMADTSAALPGENAAKTLPSENAANSEATSLTPAVNESTQDERMVVASVKLSRQVKRTNSISSKSPRESPRLERNISTPTNRRV